MSQRRNTPAATASRPANAIPEAHILDRAYELLLAVGLRGLNMADLARQAGISRATLYRRWPNATAVTRALITREMAALSVELDAPAAASVRERLITQVVRMVGALREHPLWRKIVDVDPEFLLPYLLNRPGSSMLTLLDMLGEVLRQGIAEGSIRDHDADALARGVLLTARSFVISGEALADPVPLDTLDAELADLLERYLAP